MKKIVKRIPARMVTRYQCEGCGEKYRTEAAAKKCEAVSVETKFAEVGDKICLTKDSHLCWHGIRTEPAIGRVVEVGLNPHLKGHRLEYRIEYICSKKGCGCRRAGAIWQEDSLTTDELKKLGAKIIS